MVACGADAARGCGFVRVYAFACRGVSWVGGSACVCLFCRSNCKSFRFAITAKRRCRPRRAKFLGCNSAFRATARKASSNSVFYIRRRLKNERNLQLVAGFFGSATLSASEAAVFAHARQRARVGVSGIAGCVVRFGAVCRSGVKNCKKFAVGGLLTDVFGAERGVFEENGLRMPCFDPRGEESGPKKDRQLQKTCIFSHEPDAAALSGAVCSVPPRENPPAPPVACGRPPRAALAFSRVQWRMERLSQDAHPRGKEAACSERPKRPRAAVWCSRAKAW